MTNTCVSAWSTGKGRHSFRWLASNNSRVGTVVLGDGFLEDDWPETFAGIWFAELGLISPLDHWNEVVDDDSDRDAHIVHLHGVDTLLVQGLDSEEFLETIWVLSDGLHG